MIAVTMPINEDHRWSCESPSEKTYGKTDGTDTWFNSRVPDGVVFAASSAAVSRYMASEALMGGPVISISCHANWPNGQLHRLVALSQVG
jgi:hypothetical protein